MWLWMRQRFQQVATRPYLTASIAIGFASYYTFTQTKWKCLPIAYFWNKRSKKLPNFKDETIGEVALKKAVKNKKISTSDRILRNLIFFKENSTRIPAWIWKMQWIRPIDTHNLDFTPHIRAALYGGNDTFLFQLLVHQLFNTFESVDGQKLQLNFSFIKNNAFVAWVRNGGDVKHISQCPQLLYDPNILKTILCETRTTTDAWNTFGVEPSITGHTWPFVKWYSLVHHWPLLKNDFRHKEQITPQLIEKILGKSHLDAYEDDYAKFAETSEFKPTDSIFNVDYHGSNELKFQSFLDDAIDNERVTIEDLGEMLPRLVTKWENPITVDVIKYIYKRCGNLTIKDNNGQNCEFWINVHLHYLNLKTAEQLYKSKIYYTKLWSSLLEEIQKKKKQIGGDVELKNNNGQTPLQIAQMIDQK